MSAATVPNNDTTTAISTSFPFDPVFKLTVPTLDDDLTHFPPFPQLNKQMIADLSVELRKELAEIYKLKRVREKQKERQRQRDTTRMAPTDTAAATSTVNLESNLVANIPVPPVEKPQIELPPVLESIHSITATSSAAAARSLVAPRATASSSASASSSSSSSFHLHPARSAIDEVEWSQIDRDVLNELPESIRVELQTEAKRAKAAQLVTLPMLNQGNRKRSATSAGFNGAVKVLNIAAHFKKMEKRQKRAHSNSLANANVRRDSSLTIMTDLTGASNSKPSTPILPQSPRSASSASTVTSHQLHSMPPAAAASSSVAPPSVLLDDPTTAAASAVAATSTTAIVASSSIVSPLDAYSHGGDVTHPRKGFAVVDPRGNRSLYNATAIVKPLSASANSTLEPLPTTTTNAVDLIMVDPIVPPSIPPSPAFPPLSIIDEGPVPMELDSQSQSMQLDVVIKEEIIVKEEVKEDVKEDVREEEVEQKEAIRDLHPHIDQQIELPSDAIPFESDVVHVTTTVSDDDAPTFIAFETYADVQVQLHKWITESATPPDDSHLRLLTQYCLLQLRVHRNLELVANILQMIDRIAYGRALIQVEGKKATTSATSSWRKPLQTLRASVQTEVKALFGGRLSATLCIG